MKVDKLVRRLIEKFGDDVKIRTQYHVQVISPKGPHDIWITQSGDLKFKAYGNREVEELSYDVIMRRIEKYMTQKSQLDMMREMFNVAKFIEHCEKASEQTGEAVFCDAGFKDGKARIAAVFVQSNGTVDARSMMITAANITDAEEAAIELARAISPFATVYNDNQAAVARYQTDRVKWLPREHTKIADHFANVRKN